MRPFLKIHIAILLRRPKLIKPRFIGSDGVSAPESDLKSPGNNNTSLSLSTFLQRDVSTSEFVDHVDTAVGALASCRSDKYPPTPPLLVFFDLLRLAERRWRTRASPPPPRPIQRGRRRTSAPRFSSGRRPPTV
uniref:Uncharacterized protein n=1 Tax=Musa acuminata subsp. malaccensis TaxID=214687 RepID=A0A804I6U6_MUSAM